MFKAVEKKKRLLMWTVFLICMIQMAQMALSSGIDLIQRVVFPDRSLSTIQTVLALQNLVKIVTGILSVVLIGARLSSKKNLTVIGIFMLVATGVLALVLHTSFWQFVLFSILLGLGMGLFVPTNQSIIMDNFNDKERQLINGTSFSFINLGGILMSIAGGILVTYYWYGGYLVLLAVLPIAILAVFVLPQDHQGGARQAVKEKQRRSRLPADVLYYALAQLVFVMLSNVVTGNISTHLQTHSLGNAGTSGTVIASMMVGGVLAGLLYNKLASRLGDLLIPASFAILFVSLTMLNILGTSLPVVFIAVFLTGIALSLCLPQTIVASSRALDPTNSALASMIITGVAPGVGGFLSPVIFTNLTLALGGESTTYRYQFVGIVALAAGVVYFLSTLRRKKRQAA